MDRSYGEASYRLYRLDQNQEGLQRLIKESMKSQLCLGQYHNIVSYRLFEESQVYFERLHQAMLDDEEKGIQVFNQLLHWIEQEENQSKEVDWFNQLIRGQLIHQDKVWLTTERYEELCSQEKLAKQQQAFSQQYPQGLAQKEREQMGELANKYEQLIVAHEDLLTRQGEMKKQIEVLEQQILIAEGKRKLKGLRIGIVGVDWSKEQVEQVVGQYELGELKCYAPMEMDKGDELNQRLDFWIFSTKKTSHELYYRLKKQEKVDFQVDHQNANRLFDELVFYLGKVTIRL